MSIRSFNKINNKKEIIEVKLRAWYAGKYKLARLC